MIRANYIDHMGTDKTVVNAARGSFGMDKTDDYAEITPDDIRLVKYLARGVPSNEWEKLLDELTNSNDKDFIRKKLKYVRTIPIHFVPFTHPQISMTEEVPITVARQRAKHQVGFSTSEFSRRYKTDNVNVFEPDVWRSKPEGNIKQGSGSHDVTLKELIVSNCEMWMDSGEYPAQFIMPNNEKLLPEELDGTDKVDMYQYSVNTAIKTYNELLEQGVAPELARGVLPLHLMTKYRVTGSLYAYANAYIQRSDSHAQKEIQILAKQWDEIIRPLYPISWAALVDGDYD